MNNRKRKKRKSTKGTFCLIVGLFFLCISFKPMLAIGVEFWKAHRVSNNYVIEQIILPDRVADEKIYTLNNVVLPNLKFKGSSGTQVDPSKLKHTTTLTYHNNQIKISDFVPDIDLDDSEYTEEFMDKETESILEIEINGKDYTIDKPALIRPWGMLSGRYHGFFGMGIIENKENEREFLVLNQRFGQGYDLDELHWQLIKVFPDGEVDKDYFSNKERKDKPLWTAIINQLNTTPMLLGYQSQAASGYPSLFYPILYPCFTVIVGILLFVLGVIAKLRTKRIQT